MKDNKNIELQTDNLITEKFHELLAANTKKLNDLRLEYAQRMAKAQDIYASAKASAKNYWATENEKIQIERHNIFERFRDSREVFTDDEAVKGLLHPGWTKEDKKGGDDGDKDTFSEGR